jgi:hypothetical protein
MTDRQTVVQTMRWTDTCESYMQTEYICLQLNSMKYVSFSAVDQGVPCTSIGSCILYNYNIRQAYILM